MKKLILVVITFVVITFFIISYKQELNNNESAFLNKEEEYRAIFISYLEFDKYIKDLDNDTSKANIIKIIDNMDKNNFNMAILHVRPFSDAIYKSDIFPYSRYVSTGEGVDPGYDVLSFFIEEAHKKDIEVHAWINPYRIRNNTDIKDISTSNPAYKYFGTNNIKIIEGKGIYYNPASEIVQDLIISGVEEIIKNYDVDGIHFDDYFYPDDSIDLDNYYEYLNNGGSLTLSDYRLNNTSTLIKRVYEKIKSIDKDILFGISPEGNINNNYDLNYIDTKKITSEKGYIDYIMPQIYFGFFNEIMPFMETVSMWNSLIKVEDIKLIPALAFYKAGTIDEYARSGKEEWIQYSNIIQRQVLISRNLSNYNGFSLFRYEYIFGEELNNYQTSERDNLFKIL